jgi:hypothetical protein
VFDNTISDSCLYDTSYQFSNYNNKMVKQEDCLRDITSHTTYALVWGQCSDALGEKVKAHKDYQKAHQLGSVVELLKVVKMEMFMFQTQKYSPQAMD